MYVWMIIVLALVAVNGEECYYYDDEDMEKERKIIVPEWKGYDTMNYPWNEYNDIVDFNDFIWGKNVLLPYVPYETKEYVKMYEDDEHVHHRPICPREDVIVDSTTICSPGDVWVENWIRVGGEAPYSFYCQCADKGYIWGKICNIHVCTRDE
jgi:hypothetical protein